MGERQLLGWLRDKNSVIDGVNIFVMILEHLFVVFCPTKISSRQFFWQDLFVFRARFFSIKCCRESIASILQHDHSTRRQGERIISRRILHVG